MRSPVLLIVVLACAATLLAVVGLPDPPRTVASSMVLAAALICAFGPARRLYHLPSQLRMGEAAARDIFDYLASEPRVMQLSGARVLERLQSGIELDRVTVADYRGNTLLQEISLAVPAGRRVGMVASDSQTLIALAGLFVWSYDPAFGRVLFDSRDIRHVTLDSLRDQAALVRANNVLFTGEVSENIDCGDARFTLLQITDAAKRVGAYDFIQQLPQGFSTVIGEHGEHLSPSQAFRISLARAMLREPSLLLIEEPAETGNGQDGIDSTLAEIYHDRTVILLPNRLDSLRSLERIYVFHEGRLHAQGNHAELIQNSELYRHMNYVRFNPFRHSSN